MFIVSLMSVVFVSCTNQKQEAPLAEEVEEQVTDVTFTNPQVSIADDMVTYTVTVSSSKGEEVLKKHLPILYREGSCYGYYGEAKVHLSSPIISMGERRELCEYIKNGEWLWSDQKYLVSINSFLPDMTFSNYIEVMVPQYISVTKYGKSFTFEDVNFNASAEQNLTKQDDKLIIQEICVNLRFGNHQSNVLLHNNIFTD